MNIKYVRVLEMLIRVRQFGAAHADVFPTGSRGAELFALVAASITNMETHATTQDSSKRGAKEQVAIKRAALDNLCGQLEAISRTARAMSLSTPGIADKFRMPRSKGEQAILTTARSFATDIAPHKAELIRRGLGASFDEDLGEAIAALEELADSKAQKVGVSVAATAAVSKAAEQGRNAVRELEAIVLNIFRDDPAALAEWDSASHTERASRRAGSATPSTPPAPAKG
jgi:hypothetical protein